MRTVLKRIRNALRRRIESERPWHRDLCDYYGVTPDQALQLGTRASGRRPDLPASPTTHAVAEKTFEDIWEERTRTTPAEIHKFYEDMGAWAAFRQVVRHRETRFDDIARQIRAGTRVCEYGAGVAPVSFWLAQHVGNTSVDFTIVDVPSEHLRFGQWRLQRLFAELNHLMTVRAIEVRPDVLPLADEYDVITILEVFEHLHNSREVADHLCGHLRSGGLIWENYVLHTDPTAADLAIAQTERPLVFTLLRERCDLVAGRSPQEADGGGTRCWRRR